MNIRSLISILLCAVLFFAGCTERRVNTSDEAEKAAWKRYSQAHKAKALERTLAIIDSMEQAKYIGAPRANYMRGLAYDQGWQMKIAEHYYKEAYEHGSHGNIIASQVQAPCHFHQVCHYIGISLFKAHLRSYA
jgi:hypothetical protein